jgi:hypothetical protein
MALFVQSTTTTFSQFTPTQFVRYRNAIGQFCVMADQTVKADKASRTLETSKSFPLLNLSRKTDLYGNKIANVF